MALRATYFLSVIYGDPVYQKQQILRLSFSCYKIIFSDIMKHYLAVIFMIAVTIIQSTGIIRSTTVFSSPAGPRKSVQYSRLHHYLHGYCQSLSQVIILHLHLLLSTITAIRKRILQEGEAGQLTQLGHIAVAVGIADAATILVVQTLMGTSNYIFFLFHNKNVDDLYDNELINL